MIHNYSSQQESSVKHRTSMGVKYKSWLLLMLLFAGSILNGAIAQSITNYSFQATTGTFTPLTGGTAVSTVLADDASSSPIPLGFTFYFMGVPYTQVVANSNGYITFDSSPTTITSEMRSNSFITAAADHPILAAYWDDMAGDNSLPAGSASAKYETTGAVGSRVFTFEFLNWAPWSTTDVASTLSFQIQLEEATGAIRYIYRRESGTKAASGASIGLSFSETQFISLSDTSAAPVPSGTVSTNDITKRPATNQVYSFVPVSATTPSPVGTLTFSAVGASSTTVNWTDNSTSESYFQVFISTDNVTFSPLAVVNSTSTATTGANYSFNATGLSFSTLYYYRVVALNEASAPSTPVNGSQATSSPTFCGVKVVGPSGSANHPSIGAALAQLAIEGITCGSVIELEPGYNSSVETFPISIGNIAGSSTTNTLTIRPQTGATGLVISSGASEAFNLNGTTNLIIDGRPGGVGTSRELTVSNTSATGVAIRFINGASNNTLNYLNINGVSTSTTSGVVVFSTSTAATGNSNNTISNSRIYDGATTPLNLIYSSGTASKLNTNITIANNELFNFFNAGGSSNAVNIQANSSAWTVTGNHIYQTVSRTVTSGGTHSGILIGSSTGEGFTITNNFIGGSTTNAGGTPWTYLGAFATRFSGINITSGVTGLVSAIDGNTIGNLSVVSTSAATGLPGVLSGISVQAGNANIGVVTPNIIGSQTGTGNISITNASTSQDGVFFGIASSSSGNVTIANNQIGSISISNQTSNAIRSSFTGIHVSAGTVIITGNTIGGTTANSINNATANTSTSTSLFKTIGISFSGTNGTVTNNTVQNLAYTSAGLPAQVIGLSLTSGAIVADNNTISALSSSSANPGTTTSAAIIGVLMTSTTSGNILSETEINGLTNTATTGAVSLTGIYYSGSSSGSNIISRNQVRAISMVTSGAGIITGIHSAGGASTYRNNIVNLGLDASAASITGNYTITGILKSTTANNNFFYNTIRIQGTGVVTGTQNTYAFRRTFTGTDELRNNIISNTRTNASTGGKHYAIGLNANTTLVTGRNDYWVAGPVFGNLTTDYATFGDWKTGTSLDLNSLNVDPNFISSTDSHINTTISTPLESGAVAITGITNDFDGDVRPGPVGSTNGGGSAPDIGADEFDGIPVSLDIAAFALASPVTGNCYTATETVEITIKNNSASTLDFSINPVTVSAAVTGVNPVTFTPVLLNTGTLAAGASQNVVMSTNYDMSATGSYTFNGSVALTGDGNPANDAISPVTINISVGAATASSTEICSGDNVTLTLSGNTTGIQWQSSTDGATWTNETGTGNNTASYVVSPVDTLMYRALVCGLHTSNTITINSTLVDAPVASGVTRCGPGGVTLSATGNGTIEWFATATSLTSIGTGSTLNVTVNRDSVFYVGASAGAHAESVGLVDNSGGGSQQTSTSYNIFSVFRPTVLQGVYVYPGATGNAILELRSSTGTLLNSATLVVTSANVNQKTWFPLNFNLPVANDLRLGQGTGSVSMFRNSSGVNFPYTIPGVISITNTDNGTSFNYFSYDWRVLVPCASVRTAVAVDVTPSDAITITASSTTLCTGDASTLTASSTNAGYDYTWSPATGLSSTSGASVTASPTSTTTYTVTGSDATGCLAAATVVIEVNQSPVVTVTATPGTICEGSSSQLEVINPVVFTVGTGTITNGTQAFPAPYGNYYEGARHQFLITAADLTAAGMTPGDINSLAFDVTNTNGSDPLEGFEIKIGTTSLTALASFQTGLTTVYNNPSYTITTGLNTHTFSSPFVWDGVSNIIVETCFNNTDFTLNASMKQSTTSYVSTVVYRADALGVCSNNSISNTYSQRPNITFGRSTTYTYAWSPATSLSSSTIINPVATPTTTTTYTVTVSSSNGCSSTESVEVIVNPGVTVSIATDNNVSCNGGTDGSATASSTGGTTWTYSWNTTPLQTTATATGLAAGTYTVVSTNETGCTDTASVVITEPAVLAATATGTNVNCAGGADGSATVVATGGTGTFTYSWNTTPAQTTATATNLSAGMYTVNVTDANGCTTSASVAILDGAVVTVEITGNDTICSGSSTTLTASGASTYVWNTGDVTAGITVSPVTTSTYTVTGTDVNGCTASATMEVTVESPLSVDFTYSTVTGMDFDFVATGNANSYAWDFGDNTTGTGANASHSYNGAGSYDVILTGTNSCGTDTALHTIVIIGIADQNTSSVNVYPNPSKGEFTIEMSGKEVNRITVLDIDGRIVIDETVTPGSVVRTKVDLSGHAKGVYTLRLAGEKTENFRLILN